VEEDRVGVQIHELSSSNVFPGMGVARVMGFKCECTVVI